MCLAATLPSYNAPTAPPCSFPPHRTIDPHYAHQKNLDKVLAIVGEEYRLSMSGYLFVKRKDMFRDAVFKCRGFADFSMSEEDIMTSGQCGCLDYDLHEVCV